MNTIKEVIQVGAACFGISFVATMGILTACVTFSFIAGLF